MNSKRRLPASKAIAQLLYKRCLRIGDEQTAQFASRMDTQITKLTALVDDFLDVTRLAEGKLQFVEDYFPFDTLVEGDYTGNSVYQRATDHSLQEGMTNKTIWGDRTRIGQVITNLLTNAMKYAPDAEQYRGKNILRLPIPSLFAYRTSAPVFPKTCKVKSLILSTELKKISTEQPPALA